MSFCQKLIEAADARPDKVAMTMLGPNGAETTTFGEMLAEARSLAYRLGREGIEFGDRVALIGENHPHCLWYLFHRKVFDAVRARPAPVRWLFSAMMNVNGWLRDAFEINAGPLFFKRVHQAFGGRLRLAVSGGSSFDPEVAMAFHQLGFTILQGYGLTETSGAATVTRFEDNKIGSVGTPLEGVEVEIDEPDEEGVGEILIRGPIVTPGYWRNEEANREAFTEDGWFRSGDLGRFDEQGHLYITGRKKDVIVLPSGNNVYPEEVEEHYARSPMVGEICVLGVSNGAGAFAGAEKLVAVVVPDFDHLKAQRIANTREAIIWELDNLGRELPDYQRVRNYIIRAEPLPRTSTRKVRRHDLRREIEASGELAQQTRGAWQVSLTPEDRALMDSPLGRAVADAVKG